jgi:hypothetical protein
MLSADTVFQLLFTRTAAWILVFIAVLSLGTLLAARTAGLRRAAGFLLWIAAFSVYDVFGYDFVVMTDSTAHETMAALPGLREAYATGVNAYRILQVSFQVILSATVLFAAGWRPMISGNLFWMGGGCDLLYYAATYRALPDRWDWLWFTPAGMFTEALPLWAVFLQCAVLTAVAVLLLTPPACSLLPCRDRPQSRFISP